MFNVYERLSQMAIVNFIHDVGGATSGQGTHNIITSCLQ